MMRAPGRNNILYDKHRIKHSQSGLAVSARRVHLVAAQLGIILVLVDRHYGCAQEAINNDEVTHPPLAILPRSRLIPNLTDPRLIELYQCLVTRLRCHIPGTLLGDLHIQLSPVYSVAFGRPSPNFQGVYVLYRMTFRCLSVLSMSHLQQKPQLA